MTDATVTTPYSSALIYNSTGVPDWVDEYSGQRMAAYDLYDKLYDNSASEHLLLRSSDERPVYIPSARRLINTLSRYVGKGWGYKVDESEASDSGDQTALVATIADLFRREMVLAQFASGKRDLLKYGDWVWMLSANPDKAAGKRLSITSIDPRSYFPIHDEEDPARLSGAQIVEQYLLPDNETVAIRAQTWLKANHPEHSQHGEAESEQGFSIEYREEILDVEAWYSNEKTALRTVVQQTELSGIYALPLYHIKIGTGVHDPFGQSVLSGVESLVMGINQTVTDEDMSLALAGLGMYETDAGAPVDEDGNDTSWLLGPLRVVEHAKGTSFNRLDGVTSVEPSQRHIELLQEQLFGSEGVNDIALGKAGSSVESGIALALKMKPLFDTADEIDDAINGKLTQMLYDLVTMWLPVYEGQSFNGAMVYSDCDQGSRLPFDREQRWTELQQGYAANIFSLSYVHKVLNEEFGYELTEDDLEEALGDAQRKASEADPYGARVASELGEPEAPAEPAEDENTLSADEMSKIFNALGQAVRAGVEPNDAAKQLGLSGLKFTGATPVALRPKGTV